MTNKRFTFDAWEIAMVEQLVQAAKENDRAKFDRLCTDQPGTIDNYTESLAALLDKLAKI